MPWHTQVTCVEQVAFWYQAFYDYLHANFGTNLFTSNPLYNIWWYPDISQNCTCHNMFWPVLFPSTLKLLLTGYECKILKIMIILFNSTSGRTSMLSYRHAECCDSRWCVVSQAADVPVCWAIVMSYRHELSSWAIVMAVCGVAGHWWSTLRVRRTSGRRTWRRRTSCRSSSSPTPTTCARSRTAWRSGTLWCWRTWEKPSTPPSNPYCSNRPSNRVSHPHSPAPSTTHPQLSTPPALHPQHFPPPALSTTHSPIPRIHSFVWTAYCSIVSINLFVPF